jgi:putative glutamine amidotransferase
LNKSAPKPLVGLPADTKYLDGRTFHAVGDKYARAVAVAANGIPLVIPAFGSLQDAAEIVRSIDGLVLTGSPSNVHPERYGREATPEAEPHDVARDDTTLPLIGEALEQGVPLLAICRGMQELNVALGGTLHARVHELPERDDHRRPDHDDPDVQYGPHHPVALSPSGEFERLAATSEIEVNSLHWQAIDELADRLAVEAVAPDGTIEGVRVKGARAFALGVQWHPEYKVMENEFSQRLFAAFGDAARVRSAQRSRGPD